MTLGCTVHWRATAEPFIGEPLSDDPWPVAAKKLLTERERAVYQCLLSLYPDHKLFIQVALSQLIDIDRKHPERESIRARYKQLVADFVLCRVDLSIAAVIELDDPSHEGADRQYADARKNKALADAGLRLVRILPGKLPSEGALRALIDADQNLNPQGEVVLTLAEDTYSPEKSEDSNDESNAVSRALIRVALKALFVGIVVLGGWLFFRQLMPILIRHAFQPLATHHVRAAVTPAQSIITPRQNTYIPAVSQPSAQTQAAAILKQKNLAWAAFYSAPASCEHPADWSAQVECGNQYMRAKKRFEEQWASKQVTATEIVADGSIGGPHK